MNKHVGGMYIRSRMQRVEESATHLKGGHEGLVSREVCRENEFLHERRDILSLVGWQVVQEASLPHHCLSGPAVMLL